MERYEYVFKALRKQEKYAAVAKEIAGLVDSFAMVDLVGFIETRCCAKMKPSDVNLDNLDSIGRILNYVQSNFADSA